MKARHISRTSSAPARACSSHPAASRPSSRVRERFGLLSSLALAIAAFLAIAASSALAAVDANQASAAECPNEALRAENGSLALPDCRAYELVSPSFKPVALVPA